MKRKARLQNILHRPLALDLSPAFPTQRARLPSSIKAASFAIYVEPPSARGLNEILPALRKKVHADMKPSRASSRYSALAGHGLSRKGGTSAWLESESTHNSDTQDVASYLGYRLIVTNRLEPIGYCTFSLCIRCDGSVEIGVQEVWLEARYRCIALGQDLARKIALLAQSAFEQVDSRASDTGLEQLSLNLLVSGDVYSESGACFVRSVAAALDFETRYATWFIIQIKSIACDPRW
ncbi:hypothetical protein [Paraburkholderia rhynchosiae]|uniref:N-acetyltransferase domain-containing protein n=1 Tax=Paraburkholderia rhynchosiae TaxID=487049 RepID=A0A2N7WLQ3_9BURK|nr:hypothetical protein [Paraburkholderia rhynchosiae]PMS30304.1 hypothetical protein C0Z16_15250 [Paraburkholderia rhynchosiae]CAB3690786.1 hypothetical protein LMG27174_03156 [Paraburkholderia rhynchosiae]